MLFTQLKERPYVTWLWWELVFGLKLSHYTVLVMTGMLCQILGLAVEKLLSKVRFLADSPSPIM